MMSSSSLIMVYMAPCFKELLPLVYKNHWLKRRLVSNMSSFDYNSMKLGHIIKYHTEWPISHHAFRSYCPLLMTISYLYGFGNSGGICVPWTHF